MKWSLFIDDERFPKTVRNWKIARSLEEAWLLINEHGMPEHISFDHDLGVSGLSLLPTGYDFAKSIGEALMDGRVSLPIGFSYDVHSANPVGAQNIRFYMDNLLKALKDS